MQDTKSKSTPGADPDRQFWLEVRRALLAIVAAIERRYEFEKERHRT